MTNVNVEREKVKRKIVALLNKTKDNGATEAEVISASEKVDELMEVYEIEFGELEFEEKNLVLEKVKHKKYGKGFLIHGFLLNKFCHIRSWNVQGGGLMCFAGFKHDVEVALDMFEYLENATERAIEDYKASTDYVEQNKYHHGRTLVSSFLKGFQARLKVRLDELAEERKVRIQESTGTTLVVMKEDEVNDFVKQKVRRLTSSRSNISNTNGYRHGYSAANKVNIHRKVSGNNSGVLLG